MLKINLRKIVLIGILILFFLNFYNYFTDDNVLADLKSQILNLLMPFIAVLCGIYTINKIGYKNIHGKSFLFITFGIFFWFLGDLFWMIYKLFLHIEPFPSFVDIIYLIGYPLLLIGFVRELKNGEIRINLKRYMILPILIFSFILLCLTGYFGVYLAYSPENSFWENLFGIFYGLGDVIFAIIVAFIMMTMIEYWKGKIFLPWLYLFIGILFTVAADILFALFFEEYTQEIGIYAYLDLLWGAGYLFLGYGMFRIGNFIDDIQQKIKKQL